MEDILDIENYFNTLQLEQWKILGNKGKGGQASTIEVKNLITGETGVFRTLHSKDEEDIKRFYRELDILKSYSHSNVVKILDYTKDSINHWYISKKGERFETYWEKQLVKYSSDPDALLTEAVRLISGITDGLVDLHKKGIVHRDIKFRNLIVDGDTPVLIDFGITFVLGEERLTPKNKAAANLFSPDPALNFMDEVPPWLDIFLLSQLLIWMVSITPSKNVQRPLDWRWVVYPEFSESNLIKAKALTAICSNYFTSPKNAFELKELIEALFMNKEFKEDKFNVKQIHETIQKGKAAQIVTYSTSYSLIESRLPFFSSICDEFEHRISELMKTLESNELPVQISKFESVKTFIDYFTSSSKNELLPVYQTIPIQISYGEKNTAAFGCSYLLYTKKQIERQSMFKIFEDKPVIAFTVNGSNDKLNEKGKTKSYYILPLANGHLSLLNSELQQISETDIANVIELINKSITDPEVWEIIYS